MGFSKNIYTLPTMIYALINKSGGSFEGIRDGRYFTDLTESLLDAFLQTVPSLQKVRLWCTRDVRPDREDTEWLNALLRRIPSPDASP